MASAMNRRLILWSGLGAVGLVGAIGGAWILSLPAIGFRPSEIGSRPEPWTKLFTGLPRAMETAQPTLWPCSSNTRGAVIPEGRKWKG